MLIASTSSSLLHDGAIRIVYKVAGGRPARAGVAPPLGGISIRPSLAIRHRQVKKLPIGYTGPVTWAELMRRLKAAGFVERRRGKGSHRQFVHPESGRVITVAVHTRKDVGTGLARRILKEAGR